MREPSIHIGYMKFTFLQDQVFNLPDLGFSSPMDRNELVDSFSYNNRISLFHQLIRVWNTALQCFKIEAVVVQDTPKQVVDYIIYILSKQFYIRTFTFNRFFFGDRIFAVKGGIGSPQSLEQFDITIELNGKHQAEALLTLVN